MMLRYLYALILLIVTTNTMAQGLEESITNTSNEHNIKINNDYIENLNENRLAEIYYYATKNINLLSMSSNKEEKARTYFSIAKVGLKIGDIKTSTDYLKRAYALASQNSLKADISLYLGQNLKSTDKKLALEYFKEASNFKQNIAIHSHALWQASIISRELGLYTDSYKLATQLTKIEPYKYLGYIEFGYLANINKEYSNSIKYWLDACSIGKSDNLALASANIALAQHYFDSNNNKDAIFYSERAILAANNANDNESMIIAQTILFNALFKDKQFAKALNIINLKIDTIKDSYNTKNSLEVLFNENAFAVKAIEIELKKERDLNKKYTTLLTIASVAISVLSVVLIIVLRKINLKSY